jgi:hypothetical protein
MTLIRSITRGCGTALDPADDTDNSAADFTVGTVNPRGNSVTPTETVCPPGNPQLADKSGREDAEAQVQEEAEALGRGRQEEEVQEEEALR